MVLLADSLVVQASRPLNTEPHLAQLDRLVLLVLDSPHPNMAPHLALLDKLVRLALDSPHLNTVPHQALLDKPALLASDSPHPNTALHLVMLDPQVLARPLASKADPSAKTPVLEAKAPSLSVPKPPPTELLRS